MAKFKLVKKKPGQKTTGRKFKLVRKKRVNPNLKNGKPGRKRGNKFV